MSNDKIKNRLLEAGVKNLIIFGYPDVNKENLLTDIVYSSFFKEMLKDNLGNSTKQVDDVIIKLLLEIN